jgi:murein DD-endopeptidase MepM/ murein hydrolase activator NlpD
MGLLKLPKRISIHISTSYSNRSFGRTYSLSAVITILSAIGGFVLGVIAMLVFSLKIYIDWAEVESLRNRTAQLESALARLPEVKQELLESKKELERLRIMLGIEKAPDTVDYTKLVFAYKPVIPQRNFDLDTTEFDSTQIGEEMEGFYPQVLPTVEFRITRPFSKHHPGIDFATSEGKPVFATADGVVREVGFDSLYGNYIEIRHGKYYETFYGHLQSAIVRKGERVSMNQIVGYVGNTGRSSAPHLHFEVRHKGTPIDPANLFILKREYKGGAYEQ